MEQVKKTEYRWRPVATAASNWNLLFIWVIHQQDFTKTVERNINCNCNAFVINSLLFGWWNRSNLDGKTQIEPSCFALLSISTTVSADTGSTADTPSGVATSIAPLLSPTIVVLFMLFSVVYFQFNETKVTCTKSILIFKEHSLITHGVFYRV